jgi:hypothetical protein
MGGVDGVLSDTFFGLRCHKLSPLIVECEKVDVAS